MDRNPFLDKLTALLGDAGRERISSCISDLVVNGLKVSRFAPSDHMPNRQDVTQYLASWCKDAGLSADATQTWLCDYAVSTLAPLSKSSPSAIRHSTKSNVKYIYGSDRPFVCGREGNRFRADCNKTCPVYNEMEARVAKTVADSLVAMERRHAVRPPATDAATPVKELHREQFLSAMQLVSRELSKGTKKTEMLALLKEQGAKTRTGREWTYTILDSEIRKLSHRHGQAVTKAKRRVAARSEQRAASPV